MKNRKNAFTLIELLVVIAIIAILAAILLSTLAIAKTRAQVTKARLEINAIVTAINGYDSDYGRFPTVQTTGGNDLTFGGQIKDAASGTLVNVGSVVGNLLTNAEVTAILTDNTNLAGGVNLNHVKNPQQTKFLYATFVGDTTSPGIGADGMYRDPWGNPYVITMDLNYDDICKDEFYRLNKVSGSNQTRNNPGANGLINPDTTLDDNFQFRGKVMVWSAGPNKKIDTLDPVTDHDNKDNVLSWK